MRGSWNEGTNTAVCRRRRDHKPAAAKCSCGFWAFGDLTFLAASAYGSRRDVVAVVGCHGQLVPGELGFRAEHGTVEALWLSERVPPALRTAVIRNYPGTAHYSSLGAMVAEYPTTRLPSYADPANAPLLPMAGSMSLRRSVAMTALWAVLAVGFAGFLSWPLDAPITDYQAAVASASGFAVFLLGGAEVALRAARLPRLAAAMTVAQLAVTAIGTATFGPVVGLASAVYGLFAALYPTCISAFGWAVPRICRRRAGYPPLGPSIRDDG